MNDEILRIKDVILKTTECEKIYLFGSYVYGTPHKDSDYDFFVVLDNEAKNKYLILEDISCNISKAKCKTPVDVIADSKRDFEERKILPTIERKIAREGILLYEK